MTKNKSVTKELKDICIREVGNRSLYWMRKLIKPYIPIKVSKKSSYNEDIYFYSLLYMALTEGSAESTGTLLNLKYKAPSPDPILRKFRFKKEILETLKDNLLYGVLSTAKKFGAFKQPVDIAIDPFDDPYYGDKNDIHVIGSKPKDGTSWFHSFTHLDVIIKGERFCLDFEKRILGSKDSKIVENLINNALEMVKIQIVMMDREFYQVEIVINLYQHRLDFIIPAPDTQEVLKLKQQYKDKLPIVVNHTMTSATGKKVDVKLALVERETKKGDKEIHGFITNIDSKRDAEEISEYYSNRWGIETNNRKRNEFRPLTTSRDYRLRYFYHLLSTMLHNIWVLVNLIISNIIYKIPADPIMTVRILKEFVIDSIKDLLLPARR